MCLLLSRSSSCSKRYPRLFGILAYEYACVRANVCVCPAHSSAASADCNCNSFRDWRVKWIYTSNLFASRLLLSPPRFQSIEISCDISIVDARLIFCTLVIRNAADERNTGQGRRSTQFNPKRHLSNFLLCYCSSSFAVSFSSRCQSQLNAKMREVTRMITPGEDRERERQKPWSNLVEKMSHHQFTEPCSSSFFSGDSNWIHRLLWPVFTWRSCSCRYALSI